MAIAMEDMRDRTERCRTELDDSEDQESGDSEYQDAHERIRINELEKEYKLLYLREI